MLNTRSSRSTRRNWPDNGGKLKCCLNFEVDCYVDAQRSFPPRDIPLETTDTTAYFLKMEVHKGVYWYSTDPHSTANMIAIPVQRVREIQAMNKKGIKADRLLVHDESWDATPVSEDLLENNSLTRFDPAPSGNSQHKTFTPKEKQAGSMIKKQ